MAKRTTISVPLDLCRLLIADNDEFIDVKKRDEAHQIAVSLLRLLVAVNETK